MNAKKGYLCLALHAHLPFVRHPEKNYAMEENWLYEAMTETYIPLLAYFDNLLEDGIPFKLTMSLTPTLCAMLDDNLLRERYARYINNLIDLAQKECGRTRHDKQTSRTAQMYAERFTQCKNLFENRYGRDLVSAFARLQKSGALEIVTSAATHGYLPNMQTNANAVYAQIRVAVDSYCEKFGKPPRGFWLPECGYYPGVETFLDKCGIKYFFMESHGILNAHPAPPHNVFAPVKCAGAQNVFAFARDVDCSRLVWDADVGYPGDEHYREFHKDAGFELDMKYIAPYIDPAGIRVNTGIKYHRVTDKNSQDKKFYDRENALRRASVHAEDFFNRREAQIKELAQNMNAPPLVIAPYDAELFGHWWYEGPEWLNYLIRKCAHYDGAFELIAPSEYLDKHGATHVCAPAFSSWGDGGYSQVWLNETNEWIYPHLHRLEDRMVDCAKTYNANDELVKRTLNQMARELLLAQSSDWAFIMKTGTTVEYATRRVKEHIASFLRMYDGLASNNIDEKFLTLLENHNTIFPNINYSVYK